MVIVWSPPRHVFPLKVERMFDGIAESDSGQLQFRCTEEGLEKWHPYTNLPTSCSAALWEGARGAQAESCISAAMYNSTESLPGEVVYPVSLSILTSR